MDKSANRNQGKNRSHHQQVQEETPLTGIISNSQQAQEFLNGQAHSFVTDLSKMLPAVKKFSRENWKQIAVVSAGVSLLAVGAFLYVNNVPKKSAIKATRH